MRAFRKDAHCGMRGLRRDVLPRLALRTTGMEFASEMVIRAAKEKLDIRQFPIDYHPRGGESKLSTWRDGWRHLRFLPLYSPRWLFLYPEIALVAVALVAMLWILPGPRRVGAVALFWALGDWGARSFGELDPRESLRLVVPAVLGLALGVQVVLSSFFLSVLGMRRRRGAAGGAPP